uniref:Bm14277 n=1 Tax=Brugia malayi TaxID=6279 RepID=A0A1I9G4N6_BRUMA|nr:Bm14277 [Brugia malayi]
MLYIHPINFKPRIKCGDVVPLIQCQIITLFVEHVILSVFKCLISV